MAQDKGTVEVPREELEALLERQRFQWVTDQGSHDSLVATLEGWLA